MGDGHFSQPDSVCFEQEEFVIITIVTRKADQKKLIISQILFLLRQSIYSGTEEKAAEIFSEELLFGHFE